MYLSMNRLPFQSRCFQVVASCSGGVADCRVVIDNIDKGKHGGGGRDEKIDEKCI